MLLASVLSAVVALLAEGVEWLTITNERNWPELMVGWIMLAGCLSCTVLLVIALFRFRLKGLWFALPVIIAFALPVYAVVALSQELDACQKRPDHPMCVP